MSTHTKQRLGLLVAGIALAVGMGVLGYPKLRSLTPFARQHLGPYPPPLLTVDQQGPDLRVSWNHSLAAITNAKAGLLWIRDGNSLPQQLQLAREQLRTGSLLYSPGSNQVQFRLELHEPDGQKVSESLLALSTSHAAVNEAAETPVSPVARSIVVRNSMPPASGQSATPKELNATPKTSAGKSNPAPAPQTSALLGALVPGQLIHQVLPDVPRKARETIRGTVRVGVRVLVDPSGNVVGAALDSPGPSRYFAGLALDAARRCKFASEKIDGRDVSSAWILRFEFGRTAIRFFPARLSHERRAESISE